MNPTKLILQAWADAIQLALPEVTRCYFAEIDYRAGTDGDDAERTGSDQPELPYIEILSFDSVIIPQGNTGLEMHNPKVVVTGSWGRETGNQDRTIDVHLIGDTAYTVRNAINDRMLAHNLGSDRIEGVGMTTLIQWTPRERPSNDGQSRVDQFAIEAVFTHFPIPRN